MHCLMSILQSDFNSLLKLMRNLFRNGGLSGNLAERALHYRWQQNSCLINSESPFVSHGMSKTTIKMGSSVCLSLPRRNGGGGEGTL